MSILVATDFSPEGNSAARVAAQLARAMATTLVVVHVLEPGNILPLEGAIPDGDLGELRLAAARKCLAATELAIGGDDLRIAGLIAHGSLEDVLSAAVVTYRAELAVVGGFGTHGRASYHGIAEILATSLPCPVLIARPSTDGFLSGLAKQHRLRVFAPVDRTLASDASIAWLTWLRARLPCDVFVEYLYWPPTEHARLGIPATERPFEAHPEVVGILETEQRDRFHGLGGVGSLTVCCKPGIGSVGVLAEQAARTYGADLVVVGSHRRRGWNRLMHGSISRDMMRYSDVPVVCVGHDVMAPAGAEKIHRVLVATDLSAAGKRCVDYAIDLLGDRRGAIELIFVDSGPLDGVGRPETGMAKRLTAVNNDELQRKLHGLIPEEAGQGRITFTSSVIEGGPVASAILQAAARTNADAICMSTRGVGELERALTGSVATEVIQRASCPVLIVKNRTE